MTFKLDNILWEENSYLKWYRENMINSLVLVYKSQAPWVPVILDYETNKSYPEDTSTIYKFL